MQLVLVDYASLRAPEVFRHEPYDTKVDVYAFSMCLYELFEGRAPFELLDGLTAAKAACFSHRRPTMRTWDKPKVMSTPV
jgi:serine/threonine protein kinase